MEPRPKLDVVVALLLVFRCAAWGPASPDDLGLDHPAGLTTPRLSIVAIFPRFARRTIIELEVSG